MENNDNEKLMNKERKKEREGERKEWRGRREGKGKVYTRLQTLLAQNKALRNFWIGKEKQSLKTSI